MVEAELAGGHCSYIDATSRSIDKCW